MRRARPPPLSTSKARETQLSGGQEALLLTGSPRRNGITAQMVRSFSALWLQPAAGRSVTEIHAYDAGIQPCIHSGHCKTTPACIYDDFGQIDAALRRSSLLVIASPVYGLSFPAPLKAIFDRLQRYFEEKFTLGNPAPIPRHKPAIFLAACGSNDSRGFARMTEQLDLSLRLMNATLVHSVTVANTDTMRPSVDYLQKEVAAAIAACTFPA